jgi:hypothetical protein
MFSYDMNENSVFQIDLKEDVIDENEKVHKKAIC